MEKLEPCPFCGTEDIELDKTDGGYFWVKCNECGCQLWGENTSKLAIGIWNKRANSIQR